MVVSLAFDVCCFMFLFLLMIIYFVKRRVNTRENQIYSDLIVVTSIGLIIEIFCYITAIFNINEKSFLVIFISKLFLLFIYFWSILFTKYMYVISYNKKLSSISKKIIYFIVSFIGIIIFFLPTSLYNDGVNTYSYGLGTIILYLFSFSCVLFDIFCIFFKKIERKKIYPLLMLIFLMIILLTIRLFIPKITLFSPVFALVVFLMYFTIENPDVKMIQELEVARDQANKANQAKTDFLSSMSHEIRTPLNAIVGFSDCIMDAEDLSEAKENAQDIVNASQTLLEIVNGILDISKIEAGKIEIVNSKYNALETFNELAKLITPKMREKGLDFSFNIAEDLPNTLYGDHANIKKVITNLLSNACKYTERGFVHYEVNCVNGNGVCKLIISVEDSGQGIKKNDVDKLFTKFQRLEEEKNGTIEGTGLGLAITKQLVELMGGRIIVHTIYGKGSKFTVVLNQKIETMEEKDIKKVKTTLDLRNVRILLVDDTELNLKVASKLLEKYNANSVVTCSSGFACLEKIKNGDEFDIILLDDMMPKMSGVETLNKLKELPGFSIPTVALTANAISGMKEKYLADGFDGYLAKPIEKEQLIQVINNILGRSITETIEIPKEEIEQLEENLDNKQTNIIPVVDINIPTESIENVGREYLENNGVDINHALELLGDMEMYNMTIKDFLSEVLDKWNRIVEYKNNNDMENYQIEVHSLKSDCKYLGFMRLADIAYEHELKSKEKDSDFVNNNFGILENEYKKVLDIAKTYVNKINL